MSIVSKNNELTLNEVAELILKVGETVTVLVEGHMGTGKSTLLEILGKAMPDAHLCYFDCTTADVGDMAGPKYSTINGMDVLSFIPNELLGMHLNKPVILLFDEFAKGSLAVQRACRRVMLERKNGVHALPKGSRVFATTNLGIEGVGDVLPAHARNALCRVRLGKPDPRTWVEEYALPSGLHPVVIGTVLEYPSMFESFETVEDPNSNPYIFHPKQQRAAFVTPRSMRMASDVMYATEGMSGHVRQQALAGVIGEAAAAVMMMVSNLNDDTPAWEAVVAHPEHAPLPKSGVSSCMLVTKAAMRVERHTFDAWMTYMKRLPKESQALFAKSVMRSNNKALAATHQAYSDWTVDNMWIFEV